MTDLHDNQPGSLRQAMDYLHSWAGVIFGALLFLVFFMGTLSVFDAEIDSWMMPSTRVAPNDAASFDRHARVQLEQIAPGSRQWYALYPTDRQPTMRIGWRENGEFKTRHLDPATGALLPDVGTKGGTGFFFPFHFMFHIKWQDVGYWLLALVGTAMLALIVSGVIIHKRIFTDFFTFRPGKSAHRATLDLHAACAVLLLPFHFVITLSGLIIFMFIYFKPAVALIYGKEAPNATTEMFKQVTRAPAREPGQLASVDAMVAEARARWTAAGMPDSAVRNISIANPGDKHAIVQVLRRPHDMMSYETFTVYFDGSTGAWLGNQSLVPAAKVQRFFTGLHMIPFDHWWLRWLYFALGLASCVMIATGSILWVEKRRPKHERNGQRGYRFVNAIGAAGTVGVLLATLAMLVANKLLPLDLAHRATIEQSVFFAAWIGTFAHALWRGFAGRHVRDLRMPWREQAWASAALAVLAVILNGAMTGDHLLVTLARGDWAVAGTDLMLLFTALLAAMSARKLAPREVEHGAAQRMQESSA